MLSRPRVPSYVLLGGFAPGGPRRTPVPRNRPRRPILSPAAATALFATLNERAAALPLRGCGWPRQLDLALESPSGAEALLAALVPCGHGEVELQPVLCRLQG